MRGFLLAPLALVLIGGFPANADDHYIWRPQNWKQDYPWLENELTMRSRAVATASKIFCENKKQGLNLSTSELITWIEDSLNRELLLDQKGLMDYMTSTKASRAQQVTQAMMTSKCDGIIDHEAYLRAVTPYLE